MPVNLFSASLWQILGLPNRQKRLKIDTHAKPKCTCNCLDKRRAAEKTITKQRVASRRHVIMCDKDSRCRARSFQKMHCIELTRVLSMRQSAGNEPSGSIRPVAQGAMLNL